MRIEHSARTVSSRAARPNPATARLIRLLDRALGLADRVVRVLSVGLFAGLALTVISAVFFRYVLNASLLWGEELARYMAIWLVLLAMSSAHRQRAHVSVGSLLRRLPTRSAAPIASTVAEVVTLGFCLIVAWVSLDLALANLDRNQTSPALQMPIGYVYMAIPVGFFLMAAQSTLNLLLAAAPKDDEE